MEVDLGIAGAAARKRRGLRYRRASRVVRALIAVMLASALLWIAPACGGRRPGGPGVIHHVAKGENLYRIGLRYGVPDKEIAKANGIRDVTSISVGQRLYIPGARHRMAGKSDRIPRSRSGVGSSGNMAEARRRRAQAQPHR